MLRADDSDALNIRVNIMKRLHIHMGVADIDKSVLFYSALFGEQPVKIKDDYAKWMPADPGITYAISTRSGKVGVDHLGIQAADEIELDELRTQLKTADLATFDDGEDVCCYAQADKSWVADPAGMHWEVYRTMSDAQLFGQLEAADDSACCTPETKGQPGCCEPSAKTVGCCA